MLESCKTVVPTYEHDITLDSGSTRLLFLAIFTGRSSKGSDRSLSPNVTLKMVAILSMSLGLLLQWFSIDKMTGYSLVTNANSLIASTTSYVHKMMVCVCVRVHACVNVCHCVCMCVCVCICESVSERLLC